MYYVATLCTLWTAEVTMHKVANDLSHTLHKISISGLRTLVGVGIVHMLQVQYVT